MLTSNHLPMLAAVRNGDAPGESTWDRQDYRNRYHVRSRFDRRYKAVARRQLRRIERDELTFELVDAGELVELVANAGDALFAGDADTWEAQRAEADLLDEFDVDNFAELAQLVAAQAAEEAAEIDDLPTWGDTFDPADVQWGFSVRTRP
jgi:hypothetical protein